MARAAVRVSYVPRGGRRVMALRNPESPICVLRRKGDYEKSNSERIDMTSQTWRRPMYSIYAKSSIPPSLNLLLPCVNTNTSWCNVHCEGTDCEEVSLYTDVVLFFFSFIWKTSAFARVRRARERSERAPICADGQ